MEIELAELEWDEFNINHIDKHAVSMIEIQEACDGKIYIDETYGGRYLLVGKTKNERLISMVLVHVGKQKYYVVTARDSSRGERRKAYDQEKNE